MAGRHRGPTVELDESVRSLHVRKRRAVADPVRDQCFGGDNRCGVSIHGRNIGGGGFAPEATRPQSHTFQHLSLAATEPANAYARTMRDGSELVVRRLPGPFGAVEIEGVDPADTGDARRVDTVRRALSIHAVVCLRLAAPVA